MLFMNDDAQRYLETQQYTVKYFDYLRDSNGVK